MVVDAAARLASKSKLCDKAMRRTEVIGTPLAPQVFSLLDAIWLGDPRIAEVKALDDVA